MPPTIFSFREKPPLTMVPHMNGASFPSFKCFLVLWDKTPWSASTPNSSHTAWILAVTIWFVFSGLIVLVAAWKAFHAALMTSAYLPFDFPPTTMVWPHSAGNPSMWAPNWILTKSSVFKVIESSWRGEKWPHISLTEMQHGKAIPLSSFLDFFPLKTFVSSSSTKASTA